MGLSGLEVSPLGQGGHVFGRTADEPTSFWILDPFVAEGFNLVDAEDIYGRFWMGQAGLSDSIIGRWLRLSGKRSKVLLSTKMGGLMDGGHKGLSRSHILASAENSLKRLNADHIDLYPFHFDDPDVPQEGSRILKFGIGSS